MKEVSDFNIFGNSWQGGNLCLFMSAEQPKNAPSDASWFMGLQYKLSNTWWTQLVIPVGIPIIYGRGKYNGQISSWHQLSAIK